MKKYLVLVFTVLLCSWLGLAKEKHPHTGRILLSGVVVSPASESKNTGLPDVLVEIIGTSIQSTTDRNGQFVFTEAPNGEVTVKFSKSGYRTTVKQTQIDSGELIPATLAVELIPEGTTHTSGLLTGPGTLYVAYSQKNNETSIDTDQERLDDLNILKQLPYQDPFDVVTDPVGNNTNDDPSRQLNPISTDANLIMLYPPDAPGRSTYLRLQAPPYHLAFDAHGKYLFVAGASWISVFDESDHHELVARIPIEPQAIVTNLNRSADGKWIFASLLSANPGILVLEAAAPRQVARLPLDLDGGKPTSSVSAPGDTILVTVDRGYQNGSLLRINPQTGETLFSLPVGQAPLRSVVSQDGSLAYVVNSHSASLTLIDLASSKVINTIPVGVAPFDAALSPDGSRLIVSNSGSDTLTMIDTASHTSLGFVRVGRTPAGLAFSADGKFCYVANRESGNISEVDLTTWKLVQNSARLPFSNPINLVRRP